jgi:hypothetical protein
MSGLCITPSQAAELILNTIDRTSEPGLLTRSSDIVVMDWANPKAAFTEHDMSTFDYDAVLSTEVLVAFMWKSDVGKVHEPARTFPSPQVNHLR